MPLRIAHPVWMLAFLLLTAAAFSLFGFIIGLWADGFEKLQIIPLLIITPLTFLGGTFYSIDVLPPFWQTVSLFNPIVYLISGFRWSFYEIADVSVAASVAAIALFLAACLAIVWLDFPDRLPDQELTRGCQPPPHSPALRSARDRASLPRSAPCRRSSTGPATRRTPASPARAE